MLRITVNRLVIPLKRPYYLSFGIVNHFETFLAIVLHDQTISYGECTTLPGYSWETPNSVWETQRKWLSSAKGSVKRLQKILDANLTRQPFAATPLYAALEKLQKPLNNRYGSIPLVGTISTEDLKEVEREAVDLINHNFSTLKVKIKGDPKGDLAKLSLIQSVVNGRAKLRIDANQAYSLGTIRTLMQKVSPIGIELFEQPFKPSAWNEMQQLAEFSPLPLMLDESIWSREDVEKTVELACAKYIKLKLVKHSSPCRTLELIELAKGAGLGVVLGNGVQSDFGCWDEAMIYLNAGLETDGEFNGFLKQQRRLFDKAMTFESGKLTLLEVPTLDIDTIEEFSIDSIFFDYNWDSNFGEYESNENL
jgi:L-Ala-D/L-Glu epimerase